jgi:O-antigen/teichoic acid export membrane protein
MSTVMEAGSRVRAVMRNQLDDPLARNGYALVLNTLCTGGLGVLYWVLAARLFTPAEVGRDAAALTAMALLASVGGMNLAGALAFLLPRLGGSTRGVLLRSYGWSSAFIAVLAAGFLLAVRLRVVSLPFLVASAAAAAFFLVATVLWGIFTLQDGALTGMRAAPWVLAENVSYGVVKLGALAVLGWFGVEHGIYLSWILPVLIAVPLVSALLFGRLLPAVADRADRVDGGGTAVRRFVGLNYGSALFYQGYVNVMPLLVLGVLDSRANGLFYVAWTWAIAIDLVSHSIGAALTVEGSADPSRLAELTRSSSRRLAVLLGGGGTFVVVAAPWLLAVYGPEYADHATGVLRLLVLGSVPRAVVIVEQSAARARGEGRLVLWTEVITFATVLGLAAALLTPMGPAAVGVAWLVGNGVVALLVLPWLVSHVRSGRPA